MTENDLLGCVIDLCRLYHVHVHHCRPARTADGRWRTPIQGDAGFVDVVIVGDTGVLFRELKSDRGRTTDQQQAWLTRLRRAHQDADVWRPADWPGRIDAEVRAVSGRGRAS